MGNRSEIIVQSDSFASNLVFYGHWSGTDNLLAVARVLQRTDRVGDPSYLAAQVYFEFAVNLGQTDGNLSFGIRASDGTEWVMCDEPPVYLNADTGEVVYQDMTLSKDTLKGLLLDSLTK